MWGGNVAFQVWLVQVCSFLKFMHLFLRLSIISLYTIPTSVLNDTFIDTRRRQNAAVFCKIGKSRKMQFGQQLWQINHLVFIQRGIKLRSVSWPNRWSRQLRMNGISFQPEEKSSSTTLPLPVSLLWTLKILLLRVYSRTEFSMDCFEWDQLPGSILFLYMVVFLVLASSFFGPTGNEWACTKYRTFLKILLLHDKWLGL